MENFRKLVKNNIRQYAMVVALIALMIIFQITTGGILLQPRNVTKLIMQNSYILILAIGMILCILTGGNIDLSVGSVVAFASSMSAIFSVTLGLPVLVSIFLALLMGLLAGMWQGYWIAYMDIPAFIVTLAGMLVFRGISNMILQGLTIGLPDLYTTISSRNIPDFIGGEGGIHVTTIVIGISVAIIYSVIISVNRKKEIKHGFQVGSFTGFLVKIVSVSTVIIVFMVWLARDKGLPNVLILLTALLLIYTFLTTKTVAGRHIYALGGNAKAAALSGVKTKRVMFWVYANMGLLSAVAGIIYAGRLTASSPSAGQGFELDAIASCFIGGASATGGVGTVIGAIIGGFIMGILNNGMSIMGVETFYQEIIKGLVLLGAVVFDVVSKAKAK